jgi:hypothetical protein
MASLQLAATVMSAPDWEGWPRFIPRLGLLDHPHLADVPGGAFAKPLLQARRDPQMVMLARNDPPPKVALEPEAWRNQMPHAGRGKEFNRMGELSLTRKLAPSKLRGDSVQSLIGYATLFLAAQEHRGSDAVITPSHLAGGHGSPGRDGELRLAETATGLARRAGWLTRSDQPKPLLVGITLDASGLKSPASAYQLASSYAGLPGSGYWVQTKGFTERSRPDTAALVATFLYALQGLSGRRVYAVDSKNLSWALLAGGLWGACIGAGGREEFNGPQASDDTPRKVKHSVFHLTLMRSFRSDSQNARRAFKEYPCGCGAHDAHTPPQTKAENGAHALHVRLSMADAVDARAEAAVLGWLHVAGWAAADLALEQPASAAYKAVLSAAADWRDATASA